MKPITTQDTYIRMLCAGAEYKVEKRKYLQTGSGYLFFKCAKSEYERAIAMYEYARQSAKNEGENV